jgi:hypothetical protein
VAIEHLDTMCRACTRQVNDQCSEENLRVQTAAGRQAPLSCAKRWPWSAYDARVCIKCVVAEFLRSGPTRFPTVLVGVRAAVMAVHLGSRLVCGPCGAWRGTRLNARGRR